MPPCGCPTFSLCLATTKIFPLSPRELHRTNSASTGNCFKTTGSAEKVTSMTLKHSGPDSWARKRIFLEPYSLRASPSPPLPAPLSVECPTSSKFIRSGMVAAMAADCRAQTAMLHAVRRAKRFIKSPSGSGLTFDSRRVANGLDTYEGKTVLDRPAHEARIKLLHRAHAALLHGYARLVAYDFEHALDAFLA